MPQSGKRLRYNAERCNEVHPPGKKIHLHSQKILPRHSGMLLAGIQPG
jgi:hypothetical protein